jgi:hypothetical protein
MSTAWNLVFLQEAGGQRWQNPREGQKHFHTLRSTAGQESHTLCNLATSFPLVGASLSSSAIVPLALSMLGSLLELQSAEPDPVLSQPAGTQHSHPVRKVSLHLGWQEPAWPAA